MPCRARIQVSIGLSVRSLRAQDIHKSGSVTKIERTDTSKRDSRHAQHGTDTSVSSLSISSGLQEVPASSFVGLLRS